MLKAGSMWVMNCGSAILFSDKTCTNRFDERQVPCGAIVTFLTSPNSYHRSLVLANGQIGWMNCCWFEEGKESSWRVI